MSDFRNRGMHIDGLLFLTPQEANELLQKGAAILVDLRDDNLEMGKRFVAPRIVRMPFRRLHIDYRELPADTPLILADYVGKRSREAAEFLRDRAYTRIAVLTGGIVDWVADGFPVQQDPDDELTGGCACRLRPRRRKHEQ